MYKKYLICSILCLVILIGCNEKNPPTEYPILTEYVTDNANILTSFEEESLTGKIKEIESNTTVEIAVVTLPTTNGEELTMFANKLGEKNGVGKEETDNGVIILWSLKNENGGAIAIGRGIESTLNDAKVGRIGRESKQYFDIGRYYNGFDYILNEINKEIEK